MARLHRALKKRVSKVDAHEVANAAEDYVEAARLFKKELQGLTGLCSVARMKTMIKKIDAFDREVEKLEGKIETLLARQAMEAVKLEDELRANMEALDSWLTPEEMREFMG